MFRSSYRILDGALCAIQGYAGAHLINSLKGAEVFNPAHAAICFTGIALTEKIIYELSRRVIPGSKGFLGPIPIGAKNIVSYGLATYTTFKIMELVGLIFEVPKAIVVIGVVCSAALIIGGIATTIKKHSKSFDELLEEHIASTTFANKVFTFNDEEKEYKIRIICNPKQETVEFQVKLVDGIESLSCINKYIVACDTSIPQAIITKLNTLFKIGFSTYTAVINSTNPLSYTESPRLS